MKKDGNPSGALEHFRSGLAIAEGIQADSWRAFFLSRQAQMLLAHHDLDGALRPVRRKR